MARRGRRRLRDDISGGRGGRLGVENSRVASLSAVGRESARLPRLIAPHAMAPGHRIGEPEPSERERHEQAQRDDFDEVPLGGKIDRRARPGGGARATERPLPADRRRGESLSCTHSSDSAAIAASSAPGSSEAAKGALSMSERVGIDRRALARARPRRRHRERDRLPRHAARLFLAPKTS